MRCRLNEQPASDQKQSKGAQDSHNKSVKLPAEQDKDLASGAMVHHDACCQAPIEPRYISSFSNPLLCSQPAATLARMPLAHMTE